MEKRSRYSRIKKRYGIIGKCAKNNSEILNTIDNVIRCSSCPHFIPLKKLTVRDEKYFRGKNGARKLVRQ